jgi:cytochrome c553
MRKLIAPAVALLIGAGFGSNAAAQAAAQQPAGNAAAGERKAAMCIGCHSIPGYQASFPEVHKVPMIAGQNARYLQAALGAYKVGDRRHPTMKAIAVSLSDQDMADLAVYFETLPKDKAKAPAKPAREPSTEVAELLKKGNCISCHGDNFSKPTDASFPKLGGQHADYLYVALKSYQQQRNPALGRSNPVMSGMVASFTPAQLKQLSKYIASLDGELSVEAQSRFR